MVRSPFVVSFTVDCKEAREPSKGGMVMFTPDQQYLMDRIDRSDFIGAKLFVNNLRIQGFMSAKQYNALCRMNNSIKSWSSRSRCANRGDLWDHDDLAEGWDGF